MAMLLFIVLAVLVHAIQGEWVSEMENADMFEGDIVLTPEQANAFANGYASTTRTWPKVIYYDWAPELANNYGILKAIADYEKYTCLRFHKRTNQRDYMYFFQGNGCYSGVGYSRGKQSISLGRGCTSKGVVIHEMGHRLGIYHEQSRPDRDDYITIQWENIRKGMEYNFAKQRSSAINSYGTEYDYKSVMHYGQSFFSTNGRPTIVTKDPSMQRVIGRQRGFSEIDIVQINRMYKCTQEPTTLPPPTQTQTPPPPGGDGFIIRHSSGKCIAVGSDSRLYLTSSNCNTRFSEVNGGFLTIQDSGNCVEENTSSFLEASNSPCSSKYKKVDIQADGSFSIGVTRRNNMCVHPKGGSPRPREGTLLVTWSSCNGNRLKFTARSS